MYGILLATAIDPVVSSWSMVAWSHLKRGLIFILGKYKSRKFEIRKQILVLALGLISAIVQWERRPSLNLTQMFYWGFDEISYRKVLFKVLRAKPKWEIIVIVVVVLLFLIFSEFLPLMHWLWCNVLLGKTRRINASLATRKNLARVAVSKYSIFVRMRNKLHPPPLGGTVPREYGLVSG